MSPFPNQSTINLLVAWREAQESLKSRRDAVLVLQVQKGSSMGTNPYPRHNSKNGLKKVSVKTDKWKSSKKVDKRKKHSPLWQICFPLSGFTVFSHIEGGMHS